MERMFGFERTFLERLRLAAQITASCCWTGLLSPAA
jgi:hypothetical protein